MSKGATAACDIIGFFLPRSASFEWATVMWLMWWQSMAVIRIIDSSWCAEQGVQAPFPRFSGTLKESLLKGQWRGTQICRSIFLLPDQRRFDNHKISIRGSQCRCITITRYSDDTSKRVAVSSMYSLKGKTWQMKHEGRLRQYRAFNPASTFAVITYVSVCETYRWAVLVRVSCERLWLMISLSSHKCSGEVLKSASNDSMRVNNGAIVKWSLVEGADQCLSMWRFIGSDQVDPHRIPRYERLITGGRPAVVTVAMHYLTLALFFITPTIAFHLSATLISTIDSAYYLLYLYITAKKIWVFCWEIVIVCSLSTR